MPDPRLSTGTRLSLGWAIKQQPDMIQHIATDNSNLSVDQEVTPVKFPPHEDENGTNAFRLAG